MSSSLTLKVVLGLSISCIAVLAPSTKAAGIPKHPHGPEWTSWEFDGNKGVGTVFHSHPAPGLSENGDAAHQHYINEDFGGWDNTTEIFSSYGSWIDRTGYVDDTNPFAEDEEYRDWHVPHGWINADAKPRFKFDGDWETDSKAKKAKPLIINAFSLWSNIKAHKSPATNKTLITGFGFEIASGAQAEILLTWDDLNDDHGGGLTFLYSRGAHTFANPFKITFDNSFDWDFTVAGDKSDPDKWHFFSVALHEIGHLVFLYHQGDVDLMNAPVGEPIFKDPLKDNGLPGSYRWDSFVENPDENDFFNGWLGKWDPITKMYNYTIITDKDSADGVKSLYSIPAVPGPLPLFGLGPAFGYVRKLRRLTKARHRLMAGGGGGGADR